MSTAPQTQFNIVTPAQDVNGNALTAGQITAYVVQIGGVAYTFAAPATWAPGSNQEIPFVGLAPTFKPVAGTSYTGDIEAVDSVGTSTPSGSVTWTQNAPPAGVPLPPTFTGVS